MKIRPEKDLGSYGIWAHDFYGETGRPMQERMKEHERVYVQLVPMPPLALERSKVFFIETHTGTPEESRKPSALDSRNKRSWNPPITLDRHNTIGNAWAVDPIAWWRLELGSLKVAMYISSYYTVRQTI